MDNQKNVVIFGGSGFIGSHLAMHFLDTNFADHIVIADIVAPNFDDLPKRLKNFYDEKKIEFVKCDVRRPIILDHLPASAKLIVNLAAVHREPGHQVIEYFETNLLGAEHVCEYATAINCDYIVFTSSIAVYGTSNSGPKSESSLPTPLTPYGISKLVAEKMHTAWQVTQPNRKLLIVRPGVIYGTGEAGNITRMVKAVLGHYFAYTGNKTVIKSGGYVKDLVRSIEWMIEQQTSSGSPNLLYNFTLHPPATLEKYAQTAIEVAGVKRTIFNVPYRLLLPASRVISLFSNIFGIKQPINPERVKKLLRQNNIIPHELINRGFKYKYTLKSSFEDWLEEHPKDWNK